MKTSKLRKDSLPARDSNGTLRMSTREFAMLIAVPEKILGKAMATTMTYGELSLPEPLNRFSGKTRQFYWNDCLDFAKKLSEKQDSEQDRTCTHFHDKRR